jgi:hypothetical protein
MNDMKGYYIADSWWSDDQEILEDLSKMPIISFGEKYHAFWRTQSAAMAVTPTHPFRVPQKGWT